MTKGLQSVISQAAATRNATIAQVSKTAPNYDAFIAAASSANHLYRRTVAQAYSRLTH